MRHVIGIRICCAPEVSKSPGESARNCKELSGSGMLDWAWIAKKMISKALGVGGGGAIQLPHPIWGVA